MAFGDTITQMRQLLADVETLRAAAAQVVKRLEGLASTELAVDVPSTPPSEVVRSKPWAQRRQKQKEVEAIYGGGTPTVDAEPPKRARQPYTRHPALPMFKNYLYPIFASQPHEQFTAKALGVAAQTLGWKSDSRSANQYIYAALNKAVKDGTITKTVTTPDAGGRVTVRFQLAAKKREPEP